MEFDTHVTSKIAKSWQHICYKSFIVVSFFITEKVCHHHHKWKPCSPFLVVHLSGKFLIRHKCLSLWSIKNTSLDLLEGQTREHRKCFGSIHGQYSTPWQTVSSSPAWYGAEEIWSFLDWQLDRWQYLAYLPSESHVWATPSGSSAFLELGCPTCKDSRGTL